MNYEQLIEELREEMLQLVNTKCDALLQMYRSGEMHTDKRDTIRESSLITVSPAELKGKRPLAVQFAPGEWIETPTWRKVAQKILQTCNEQPDIHERFMEMCGKVAGRWRTILGSSPEEMDVPIKVDEELYFEGKFDTEAMLNMLEKKVLGLTGQLLEEFAGLQQYLGDAKGYLGILMKVVGITYLCEFSAGICKDAGFAAVSDQIEILGKLSVLFAGLPILLTVIRQIYGIL